ncbi:MAG TPA: MFS transporter [Micromonosporaceae bacterium]
MATKDYSGSAAPPGTPGRSEVNKVVVASLIGTTIEWYDFFLYGTAAALVFGELFFPKSEPLIGTMLAFATYAFGFVARPIGAVVFGHFGDRIGRKSMLVLTLVLMGVATFLIGLLPTFATLGLWAAAILVLLRLVQGFALGGEWGGAVLMAAEYGQAERRGLRASWPQAGVPIGLLLSTAVISGVSAFTDDAQFLAWGWRIPFLLSIVLIVVGLWVRLSIAESPVFQAAQERAAQAAAEARKASPPILEVVRRYPRTLLIAMGARIAENVSYYVFTAFVLVYITEHLGMDRQVGLNALLIAALVHLVVIPTWASLSDRVGRRPVYLLGAVGVGVWAFVFFWLLDGKSAGLVTLAIAGGLVFHAAMYGPQAAFFSELFGTNVRYTGASVGYQLASVVAGSVAPLIAVALLNAYGTSFSISLYLLVCVLITIVAVVLAKETRRTDLAAVETEREELAELGP